MTRTGKRPVTASLLRLLPLCAALGLAASCVPPGAANRAPTAAAANGPITTVKTITINGVFYATPAAALDGLRQTDEGYVAGVAHEADPVRGSVRIILPDADRLRPLVAQNLMQTLKRLVTGEALDFFIEESRINNRAAADALLKSGEFESGTIVEQNDVSDPPQGDAEYLVWFQVRTILPNNTGAWIGHWLVRRRGSSTVQAATFDLGTAIGAPRYDSFIKSVRAAALRLGGRSRAGATAKSLPGGAVVGQGSIGSGIVIDTRGHVLTNEHVIHVCERPQVTDAEGHRYDAKIDARDAANDLALLSTAHRWPDAASLRDGREPRPGDAVVVTGYPLSGMLGSGVIVTTGSLSALSGPNDDSRLLQLSAPVQPGNSGGPVLDDSGRVIGMVSQRLNGTLVAVVNGTLPQNVNFAIKSAILRNFLDTRQIDYAHGPPARELQSGDVADLARKFTVRVACGAP